MKIIFTSLYDNLNCEPYILIFSRLCLKIKEAFQELPKSLFQNKLNILTHVVVPIDSLMYGNCIVYLHQILIYLEFVSNSKCHEIDK